MVNDLPEPCVCQMMPLRWRGVWPVSRRCTPNLTGSKLLVTADYFYHLSFVIGGKEGESADDVQQILLVEHPSVKVSVGRWGYFGRVLGLQR